MANWLHWIGKSYYTMNSFAKEAEKYGVSRRVSLQTAKQMTWGDTVYCAMLDGKTGVLFGYFTIERITGLSKEATQAVLETHECTLTDEGGGVVSRGCGEYISGPSWQTKASLDEIVETVKEVKENGYNEGQIMIAGTFIELEKTRLLDIPFRQGFRKFDSNAFYQAVKDNSNAVRGQFYKNNDTSEAEIFPGQHKLGQVQQVSGYKSNPNRRKKRQHKAKLTHD